MKISDFRKVERLIHDREKLCKAKTDTHASFDKGVEEDGTAQVTFSSMYSHEMQRAQIISSVWLTQDIVEALCAVLDMKIGVIDCALSDMGVETGDES